MIHRSGGPSETDMIEEILDRVGVDGLLDVISDVCMNKSDHLASVWQDPRASKDWQNAGIAFQIMKEKPAIAAVMYKGR